MMYSGAAPPTQRPPPRQLDPNQLRLLEQQGFTSGLIQAVANVINTVPLRVWVIDNGSSMTIADGHRFVGSTYQALQKSDCTRWEEAHDTVAYHSYMAGCMLLPTRFVLLNNNNYQASNPQYATNFSVGEHGSSTVQQELQMAKQIMSTTQPYGPTALTEHLLNIRNLVAHMAPQLQPEGKSYSVVIVTAGLPSDAHGNRGPAIWQQFVQALKSLENLPVSVVIRLCTDDDTAVDFYNALDAQVDLHLDILDDFEGEALEVYLKNPWLNYAQPLHRFRELGLRIDVLDEIDERALNYAELRQLIHVLFYVPQGLPDPALDWATFLRAVAMIMAPEKIHYNPIKRRLTPWLDLPLLHAVYGRNTPFPHDIPVQVQPSPSQFSQQQPPHAQQPMSGQWRLPPQQSYPGQMPPQQRGGSFTPQQQTSWQGFNDPSQPSQQHPPFQQNQQSHPQPGTAPPPSQDAKVSASKYSQDTAGGDDKTAGIKRGMLAWATAPPTHMHLRTIDQLLGSVPQTFPPAFGVAPHEYFQKWKPLSLDALKERDEAVLRRAVRKTKFFLHTDKLPRDFTTEQSFLCKMLWDIVADAWEAYGGSG